MNIHRDQRWPNDILSLLPGEWAISRDAILSTVLGTCISVVLFSPSDAIGGMNHFMLPESSKDGAPLLNNSQAGRYGVNAMELLINGLMKEGIDRHQLKAKVFGGGRMFIRKDETNPTHIGIQNLLFVEEFLKTEKIPVLASDVSGVGARRIYFFPWNGKVLLKRYQKSETDQTRILKNQEETFRKKLIEQEETRVILFDSPPQPQEKPKDKSGR